MTQIERADRLVEQQQQFRVRRQDLRQQHELALPAAELAKLTRRQLRDLQRFEDLSRGGEILRRGAQRQRFEPPEQPRHLAGPGDEIDRIDGATAIAVVAAPLELKPHQ